ncbi:MAG: Ig-like domain-containing protein, partial [Verrucomicrobiota bacterium]
MIQTRFTTLICVGALLLAPVVHAQSTLPVVAIHDSELTRALATMPATGQTPTGPGTTGAQWWSGEWNYFVMPETMKEMLRADGTTYRAVSDADISAGDLVVNGQPKYPIMISLAAEAIRDDEIARLRDYVAAGGFLFMGSSSFTRQTNGAPRGNFVLATEMGIRLTYYESAGGLLNWINVTNVIKATPHRITSHIPDGPLTWRMPEWQYDTIWGTSPEHNAENSHDVFAVSNDNSTNTATILMRSDNGLTLPYLTVHQHGKGFIIYYAPMQPALGFGGYAPGMYAYRIFRNSIEWAFETLNVPVTKLSPWPYEFDAAFSMRHDLENFQFEITNIINSAQYEATNGVKGDYYFCTGTLRQELGNNPAVIASLRQAITSFGATIASHNGGLPNPVNLSLTLPEYDYWHWGPDEALDVTPVGYASGKQYATISLSNSFVDIDNWTAGLNTGVRKFAGCYFNSSREDSNEILEELGVKVTGEHKLGPFPHWTVSTRVPNKRFPMLTIPVSDWFVNGTISQSLDYGSNHDTNTVRAAVDAYYNLGGLINLYTHSLADGQGVAGAGGRVPEYIRYSMDSNLHPRLWSANAQLIYDWSLQRSNVQVTATHNIGAYETTTTLNVSGATDPRTSVEIVLPTTNIVSGIEVFTNGVAAYGEAYRLKGRNLKVRVGNTVNLVEIRIRTGADSFASDDFTRTSYPAPVSPWVIYTNAWTITGGEMRGGPNPQPQNYGYVYLTNEFGAWTDFAVSARIKFPVGAFGGGIGGRLNPTTGAHYAVWIYPEGSSFGSSMMSLIKFQGWTAFGYNGNSGTVMQTMPLPGVGTNWHTVKLAFSGNKIAAFYDGSLIISATDIEAQPYTGGGICLDQYTELTPYLLSYDDVTITPLMAADQYNVTANTPLVVAAPGVLTNDTRFTATPAIATLSSPPINGSLTLNPNGGFTYTPNFNFTGYDTFVYVAGDGTNLFGTATVTLFVNPTHLGPSLLPQTNYTIFEGTTLVVSNTAIDTDIPPPVLTYSLVGSPTNAVISTNGIITWTPSDAQGPSTNIITTIVVDNRPVPFSATNSFEVIVLDTNNAPVLPVQVNRFIGKLMPLTVTNTAVDVDVPVDQLTYTLVSAPVGAAISANGIITWTPSEAQDRTTNVITTIVTDNGTPVLSATNSFTVVVESTPEISLVSSTIVTEGCPLVNNAIDPGETITMSFVLRNTGRGDTANLIATLLETNGVAVPSAPQSYGILVANGANLTRTFSFAATGNCGESVTSRLKLQDGPLDLGTVSASFLMGMSGTIATQNFDTVTAPALPANWTTATTGAQPLWVTVTNPNDSAPNSAATTGAATPGVNELVSLPVILPSASAQLVFRHSYNLEPGPTAAVAYDGGVLEISIGTNAFVDILAAGGTFASGAYNRTIATGFGNQLAGRQAWSGNANAFNTVTVNLPATALGKS